MTTLTNDQMVEISGGVNWDALEQDVCLNCYRALLQAGITISKSATFSFIGALVAALIHSIDIYVSCKPCVDAVMAE
ncbi:MAG: hypothetical protein J6T97_05520 [Bacteroidaceae bacterium]|nr:hypothetical protein [Bacteroidaceae bacterium]